MNKKMTTKRHENETESAVSIYYEDGSKLEFANLKDQQILDIASYASDSDEPACHIILDINEAKALKAFLNQ